MATTITKATTPTKISTMLVPTPTYASASASVTASPSVPVQKKSGPPVPPRPQHTLPVHSLLKAQREASNKQRLGTTAAIANTKITVSTGTKTSTTISTSASTSALTSEVVGSSVGDGVVGRTVIYKSPSINLEKKPTLVEKRSVGVGTNLSRAMSAPKPPLKLRKAPDIPVPRPKPNIDQTKLESDLNAKQQSVETNSQTENIVIVQSSNGITLNRHNSMCTPKTTNLQESRLSLDSPISQRSLSVQLEQLKPGQPLPRPRKIVQVPVATLDVEDETNATNNTSSGNIFRRSKTTLDNLASRANITTISTVNASNSFLGGKTVEIKNNLKNAAERLFSEIVVNQQKQTETATIITKHERAIQHQALLEQHKEKMNQEACKITVVTSGTHPTPVLTPNRTPIQNNCTRININTTTTPTTTPTTTDDNIRNLTENIDGNLGSGEKKIAFHEMLISELAAMRTKSSSMEALSTKTSYQEITTPQKTNNANVAQAKQETSPKLQSHSKPMSNEDLVDVDADNIDDVEGDLDDDEFSKRLKVGANNTQRTRCPSGCSSDSSPYGTERSSRIRTSDWIEVGDNGKKVTMSSCHISLEDSGMEDEERLDEMSSSGVGDSWDSVKEVENDKRARSVQRAMSITELPPLPKSLSGFNKMLGSDSGLLSDNDAKMDKNSNKVENVNGFKNNSTVSDEKSSNSDNDNNNNNNDSNSNNDSGIDYSLSQELKESDNEHQTESTETPTPTASTTLDTQLATLKKEMFGLRQLDLSLLSQLWALNDSIQEFRTLLREQEEEDAYTPHSPSPSSYDSVSSDGEDDVIIAKHKMLGARPKIITTQPKLVQPKLNEDETFQTKSSALNSVHVDKMNASAKDQQRELQQKPSALSTKPQIMPRMRSAPPPPPIKTQSPTRQT